jgi:hypothetical protein
LFKDLSKVRAQKQPKIAVSLAVALVAAGIIVAVSNDNDAEDLYPSDAEVSEDDDVTPPCAGIDSLNICTEFRTKVYGIPYKSPTVRGLKKSIKK